MARSSGTDIQNTFIRGLITEATGLKFPKDACTETWDCVFEETGRVSRRLGYDNETDMVGTQLTIASEEAWTEFMWHSVAGEGDLSFLVRQKGKYIQFYDVSNSVETIGATLKSFAIDLDAFIPSGSSLLPRNKPCKYAHGNGNLIIVNANCEPILVTYDEDEDTIAVSTIELKYRDFAGIEDGLTLTQRVTASVATLQTSYPNHYYNILNQGWHATDALTQWDAARTDMPSNGDMVPLYRSSATDAFDNALITSKGAGNTPAPKGHFILDVHSPDRTQAMVAEGFTGAVVSSSEVVLGYGGSVTIGTITNPANAFDGNIATLASKSSSAATVEYVGKTFAAPETVSRVVISSVTPAIYGTVLTLYGKTGAAPAAYNDGTNLGSTLCLANTDYTILSTNASSSWDHIWLSVSGAGNFYPATIGEIVMYQVDLAGTEAPITYSRPSANHFFSGRAWYAGIDGLDLNNSVFFSQIVQRNSQYGLCYQAQDPTSEDFPELLPDDGGVVKIPEIASIVHLDSYGNTLLVFATNGVWAISGGNRQYFAANNFGIRKISGVGTNSPLSFINYKGLPVWWGESGIYTLQYDPNYDSFSVQSLTDETIFSFINDIPKANRRYVKGAFNPDTEVLTWLYNDAAEFGVEDRYKFNRCLEFNGLSKAFYPSTISADAAYPFIRGILYCKSANDDVEARIKFITSYELFGNDYIYFTERNSTTYTDWDTEGHSVPYSSYFITGYAVDNQGDKIFHPRYISVFMDYDTAASCYMRTIYDWTTSGNSGRWSSSQQTYNSSTALSSVSHKRLALRGHGRAFQIKFNSSGNAPFSIIGWTIWTTGNSGI
jgi:hypothetical protein